MLVVLESLLLKIAQNSLDLNTAQVYFNKKRKYSPFQLRKERANELIVAGMSEEIAWQFVSDEDTAKCEFISKISNTTFIFTLL